jgi:tRNA-binding EMAP/Myf-like protein
MKTIFLDIDGVLNVDYADRDQFGHIFRDEYVHNLKEIIEKTGAKIVISSTWKDKGIERMLDLWKERNLPGEIIDVTPDCVDVCEATNIVYYDQVKRGHEIKLWLDRHPEVTQYVILDDIQDFLDEQQDYFVNCSTGEPVKPWKLGIPGLKEECKTKAINILNMKDKIEFSEFLDISSKLEIKPGTIKTVTDVTKSDKLIKLEVDL